ncbi:MAG TPA: hypothetical protein VNU68_08680 [Verrucomicrobiae bacterium]|nr:hypothetical protein [Verrucomicrobiae bacterium]
MDTAKSNTKLNPLQALIVRRSRGPAWAYGLWLLVYLPTALLFADEMSAHSGAGILAMFPLLIPVAVAASPVACQQLRLVLITASPGARTPFGGGEYHPLVSGFLSSVRRVSQHPQREARSHLPRPNHNPAS